MKTRYWLIICLACLLLGAGTWAVIDYYVFPCKGTFKFTFIAPTTTKFISRDPECVNREIEIIGLQREKYIDLQASDGCKTGYRTMEIDVKASKPKWTLQLGIPAGGLYIPELKKADAILGIEPGFIRHFKNFGIGAAVWYHQGLTTQYKSG
jgi:hypothetical protein